MERWEYAVGHERLNDTWTNDTEPGTFEAASKSLIQREIKFGDEDWAGDQCIVKRSDRFPEWQPVHDHAAELLAEVLTDIALRFASNGNDIMQGKDLNRVIKHVAFGLRPTQTEEYDS